jgi:hypothetical protein
MRFHSILRFAAPAALFLVACAHPAAPISKDPVVTSASVDASAPSDLKAAALSCNVPAFRAYMPPETATKIAQSDDEMRSIGAAFDDLFALSQQRFGAKVRHESHGLKFEIDAADPRWSSLFGPQWESIKRTPGPKTFNFDASIFWKEECDVVRTFRECLDDARFCTQPDVPGSMVQIRQEKGRWQLVSEPTPQDALRAPVLAFIRSSIAAFRAELAQAPAGMPDEDVLYALASHHLARVQGFAAEMQRASAGVAAGKTNRAPLK